MSESLEIAQEKVRETINKKAKEYPWYNENYILDVFTRVRVIDADIVIESEIC